jgi:hypothetical protein
MTKMIPKISKSTIERWSPGNRGAVRLVKTGERRIESSLAFADSSTFHSASRARARSRRFALTDATGIKPDFAGMAQPGELNDFHSDQFMHMLRFMQVKREQSVRA